MLSIRLSTLRLILLLSLLIGMTACSAEGQSQLATFAAPIAQTAAAKGGSIAKTQAARLQETAEARLATEAAELKETAKAAAATQAAELIDTAQACLMTEAVKQITQAPTTLPHWIATARAYLATEIALRVPQIQTQAALLAPTLGARLATEASGKLTQLAHLNGTASVYATRTTPNPPLYQTPIAGLNQTLAANWATANAAPLVQTPISTPKLPTRAAVLTYTVMQGESLSSISERLPISKDRLLQLNVFRYPSLLQSPDIVQPGWTLVIGTQPEGIPIPWQSPDQPAWSITPNCDVRDVAWLVSPITCEYYTIDIVTGLDQVLECVSANNLAGERLVHTVFNGWMLTSTDNIFSYGWFVDARQGIILPGPAIVLSQTQYTECKTP